MLFLCSRGPVRAPGCNAYFIRFLILALYTHHGVVVVYILFTCMLPHLSFPLRIDPLLFQAGCRKKVTKPGSRLFCVIVHFCEWRMCVLVVLGLVFHTKLRDWLGETSPK